MIRFLCHREWWQLMNVGPMNWFDEVDFNEWIDSMRLISMKFFERFAETRFNCYQTCNCENNSDMNKNSFFVSTILIWNHIPKSYLHRHISQSKTIFKFSNFIYEKRCTNFLNNLKCRFSTPYQKNSSLVVQKAYHKR